jgi:ribosomal protein S18 acetylase RimI-like enzyme
MIRAYQPADAARIISILQEGDAISPALAAASLRQDQVWVYQHGAAIEGCAGVSRRLDSLDGGCEIWVYAHPKARGRGIGSALWHVAEPAAGKLSPSILRTEYRLDQTDNRPFFQSRGFQPEWAFQLMAYRKPTPERSNLDIRRYQDAYFLDYLEIKRRAFTALAKTYGWNEDNPADSRRRAQMQKESDEISLLFVDNRPVGIGRIHRHYIDTIAVLPEFGGQGLGKALVTHCLYQLRERGIEEPRLLVATKNQPAIALYQRLKFDLLQINERSKAEPGIAD